MDRALDVLLIHPDSSAQAYQGLAATYSAIEPPTWALLLAQSCRAKGFGAAIMDCDAEKLSLEAAVQRAKDLKPRLVVFVVYGQNPNSGTTSMIGATRLAEAIKQHAPELPIGFVGSHTSALPREVLALPYVDIVFLNEGVYALHNLLRGNLKDDLAKVAGIGWKKRDRDGKPMLWLNPPQSVVPQERMDQDLPGYAWDLLPYRERPLDLYRAHFWHAGFDHAKRTPFAAIYTSLGCNFGCDFCMINIVNRSDNGEDVHAAHSRGMRFWSPSFIAAEMEKLAGMGVQTLRISDEMFFLNRRYYEPLLADVIDRRLGLNMWTYSRVDTVRPAALETFKRAGVNWLALGIEAGSQTVRKEVSKGSFQEVNIREVCKTVRDADINVISNYIFGFPDDTLETMQQTLDLALELNTEMANMYPCQALPGSPIYRQAIRNGWKLPESYAGYAFLSYDCEPLATKHVSAAEVLRFRDEAFQTYFTHPAYLELVERRFGAPQRANVEEMAKIRLKRKLLGD
ncbi:MAG: cobalamin-dependent protein [Piscinibacter sp.]|nr:cobalamin-dependent protein [Piscinibacter sp.]